MHIAALIIVCLLGAWLIAYLDHRSKFLELFFDVPGLIFGMLIALVALFFLHHILNFAFAGWP